MELNSSEFNSTYKLGLIVDRLVLRNLASYYPEISIISFESPSRSLSGSSAKSGPLNFGTKNNFSSFFVSEKGLVHIYKKEFIIFQFLSFALLRAKIAFWPN